MLETVTTRAAAVLVGADLELEAVSRLLPSRRHHHAGIVDKQVELIVPCREPIAKGLDRRHAREVETLKTNTTTRHGSKDARDRISPLVRITPCNDDLGAGTCQGQSIFVPKPPSASDNRDAPFLRRNIGCRPLGHKLSSTFVALGVISR